MCALTMIVVVVVDRDGCDARDSDDSSRPESRFRASKRRLTVSGLLCYVMLYHVMCYVMLCCVSL